MGKEAFVGTLILAAFIGATPAPTAHPYAAWNCVQLGTRTVTKGQQVLDELYYLQADAWNYATEEYAHYTAKEKRDEADFHAMKAEFDRRCEQ